MRYLTLLFLWVLMMACPRGMSQEENPPSLAESTQVAEVEAITWDTAFNALVDFLTVQIGANTYGQVLLSFTILLLSFVFRKALLLIVFKRLKALASRTNWKFDDRLIPSIEGPISSLVIVVGLFFTVNVLTLTQEADALAFRLFQGAIMVIVFWGILRLVDLLADSLHELADEHDSSVYHFIPLLKKAARVFLIIIGTILVIQNLGYSVSSLMAGLGIGGLAVALAAQESLGNFFGSLSIIADRPFKVGDWIQVGDKVDGDVEEIGLRSTKVRTWAKSQLTIPNKVLANEIVENWSRMPKRRVKQVVGVTYETQPEDMAGLVEDIRELLRNDPDVHQEFILVNFTDFGTSSLDILVYYFTKTTKWLEYMDVRQRVNLKIMKAINERGLSIAFPTRTLYLEGDIASRMVSNEE
ncbi:MAG: mechanosensitive ion channel family protein [Opitutaceae bacterium]|nr:mechanosensitive ion channel family protein [Opitutaceae bacterium]